MSEPLFRDSSFEARLRREVDRVLADPAFQRSPVQARLLEYLCEQTIARNRRISQIAVAVDGLGRPETADQLTESYPRVQISRLRRNLSLYYARCAPGEGLALYIGHGDYQLRMAPPDSAYSAERQGRRYPPPANDPVPAAAMPAAPAAEPGTGPSPQPGSRRSELLSLAAAVVAGILLGKLDARVEVEARGGVLTIEWRGSADRMNEPVRMTGPAETVFEGEIDL